MVRCVWRVTICGAASWCTRSCRLLLGGVIRQPPWGAGAPFTHNKKKAAESEEPDLKPPPLKGGLLWKVWEVGWGQMVVITHFHGTARPQYWQLPLHRDIERCSSTTTNRRQFPRAAVSYFPTIMSVSCLGGSNRWRGKLPPPLAMSIEMWVSQPTGETRSKRAFLTGFAHAMTNSSTGSYLHFIITIWVFNQWTARYSLK